MKKKNFLAIILSLALTAFAACSMPNEETSGSTQNSESSSTITEDNSNVSTEEETPSNSETGDSGEKKDSGVVEDEEKDVYYTVQFDTQGGSTVDAVRVKRGEKITAPATPTYITKECEYVFVGWLYKGEKWDFAKGVAEDMTLTAEWKEGEKYTEPILPKD